MKRIVIMVFVLILLLLSACSAAPTQAESEAAPKAANTDKVEPTAEPTREIKPTLTPIPPTPTTAPPSELDMYLEGVRITEVDEFKSSFAWELYTGSIKDGVLEIQGKDWNGLMRVGKFVEGNGFIVKFKYDKSAEFEVMYDFGQWWTEPYRRFGIYIFGGYPKANLWLGQNGLGFNNLHGNFQTQADTWYSLLMAVDEGGEFLAVIWDPEDPTRVISYHEMAGEQWAGYQWDMRIGANKGTIVFDDFMKFEFDTMK